MSQREGHSERMTLGSQASVLQRGRRADRCPQAALVGPPGPGEQKTTKEKEAKQRAGEGIKSIGHAFRESTLAPSKGLTPVAGRVGHDQPLSEQWPRSPLLCLAPSCVFPELLLWAVTGAFSKGRMFCCHSSS